MDSFYRFREIYRTHLTNLLRSEATNWVRVYDAAAQRYAWAFGEQLIGRQVVVTQDIGGQNQQFHGCVVGFDEFSGQYQVEFELQIGTVVINQYGDFSTLEVQRMGFEAAGVSGDEAGMLMDIFGLEDDESPIPY